MSLCWYGTQVQCALSENKRDEAWLYSLKGRKIANTSIKMGITGVALAILFLIVKDKVPYSSLEYDYYLPDYVGAWYAWTLKTVLLKLETLELIVGRIVRRCSLSMTSVRGKGHGGRIRSINIYFCRSFVYSGLTKNDAVELTMQVNMVNNLLLPGETVTTSVTLWISQIRRPDIRSALASQQPKAHLQHCQSTISRATAHVATTLIVCVAMVRTADQWSKDAAANVV